MNIPKNPGVNKTLLQDLVGQSYYELIPVAVRSALDLLPEEFFRNTIVPMLGVLNIALPAVAVAVRKMTNLAPGMDDAISEVLSEIRRGLNEKAKEEAKTAGTAHKVFGSNAEKDQPTVTIGLAVLLLSKKKQAKFFANLGGVKDKKIRCKVLALELEVPKDVAKDKFKVFGHKNGTISEELKLRIDLFEKEVGCPLGFAIAKVSGLADLPQDAFLVWVESVVKKDPPKKDMIKDIKKAINKSKKSQEQIIAQMRQDNADRKNDADNRAASAPWFARPFVKFINSLKGY
jgi:hypothetical protein